MVCQVRDCFDCLRCSCHYVGVDTVRCWIASIASRRVSAPFRLLAYSNKGVSVLHEHLSHGDGIWGSCSSFSQEKE